MPLSALSALPRWVRPMLARRGLPFDSDEHLFEIKWDGTRVLAFVEGGACRLVNRHQADVTDRYPELEFLAGLPPGLVLDGEVVVLRQGKPDFRLLLSRNQARDPLKIDLLEHFRTCRSCAV
jgi:bifunctional non-homologous end joining protein LigD